MKKVIVVVVVLLCVLGLVGCGNKQSSINNSNNNTYVPNKQVKTVSLTKENYNNYFGFSYQLSINGPQLGDYGYDYIFNVQVYSLDPKYKFNNVKVVFTQGSSSGYNVATNGNSSFTITTYQVLNSVTPRMSVLNVSGTVSWEE